MTHSIPPDGSAHVLLMVGSCLFRLPVIVQGKRVSTEHIQAAIQVCTQPRLLALMETCPASRFWIEAERWPLDITALTLIQDAIDDADARPASVFGASRYADPPIALLTSRERTKWARAREQLVGAGGVNAESMQACISHAHQPMLRATRVGPPPVIWTSFGWQAAEEALFGVTILDKPSGLAEAHRRSDKVSCLLCCKSLLLFVLWCKLCACWTAGGLHAGCDRPVCP